MAPGAFSISPWRVHRHDHGNIINEAVVIGIDVFAPVHAFEAVAALYFPGALSVNLPFTYRE